MSRMDTGRGSPFHLSPELKRQKSLTDQTVFVWETLNATSLNIYFDGFEDKCILKVEESCKLWEVNPEESESYGCADKVNREMILIHFTLSKRYAVY